MFWHEAENSCTTALPCATPPALSHERIHPGDTPRKITKAPKTRLCKRGNVSLRKRLDMPALMAKRHNPCVAALCQRLHEKGLTPKTILGAANGVY